MITVGVISDTHGRLRPEALARLRNVQHIVHAGDIGAAEIVPMLQEVAPVTAVRGNVDTGAWASALPESTTFELGGRGVHVLHDLQELGLGPAAAGLDVVIFGHSHRPRIETIDRVLYLNPGSAGPRRFRLPVTMAILELDGKEIRPRILDLADPC